MIDKTELEQFKKNAKILIVDDNENNVYLLQRLLIQNKYENLVTVQNGAKALEILEQTKVDLVLLDVMMPVLDGYGVLEKVKDKIVAGELIVLMISAASEIENIIKGIKLGASDFLPKPFNGDLLKARISSCLERRWFILQQEKYLEQMEAEKKRREELLKSIFPLPVVEELVTTNSIKPRKLNDVAILFIDLVGFTSFCNTNQVDNILDIIQRMVDICEVAAITHNVQKIKTIGDGFMAAANIFSILDNPVLACIKCANEIFAKSKEAFGGKWQYRAGIAYGEVITGVVGHRQYLFDIWGDSVNVSSRVQALAEPETIYLSASAFEQIKNISDSILVKNIDVKGKGNIDIYQWVDKKG